MSSLRTRALSLFLVALLALAPTAGCIAKVKSALGRGEEEPVQPAGEEESPSTPATPTPRRPTPNPTTPPTTPPTSATPPTPPPPAPPEPIRVPSVVVAVIDSGINPYHLEFRDDSPLGAMHPSRYIPGYPEDAKELRLTLSAGTLEDALAADNDTWDALAPDTLYWIPGTRIVGLVVVEQDGERPGFDDNGHGTMTASRAAGRTTSLAPTARIVAIEGLGGASVLWAASQPWIDVQSNSWAMNIPDPATRAAFAGAAKEQAVVSAAGNGVGSFYGVAGQPSSTGATSGAPGVIAVGGHDNGRPTAWSGSMPHVVADACWNWAAVATTMTETGPRVGTGTSSSAPYVAGAIAALILDARTLMGVTNVSHEGGVFASGPSGAFGEGPLADGNFTLDDVRSLVLATANPRPTATPHDGDACSLEEEPGMAPYATLPGDWSALPPEVPAYYFLGYGAVNVDTLVVAREVLAGRMVAPARGAEDGFATADDAARSMLPV